MKQKQKQQIIDKLKNKANLHCFEPGFVSVIM